MSFFKLIKRNLQDERGSFSVEAILMFPLLAWAFMAMYVFFEGLRESNINLKANYTVSDLLSREVEDCITNADMNGMHDIYEWLSRSRNEVQMRATVIFFEQPDPNVPGEYKLMWSEPVNGPAPLTSEDLPTVVLPHMPIMADGSYSIVVETWALYDPIMDVGLTDTELYNIVVTAPRFSGKLCHENEGSAGGTQDDDENDELNDTNTSLSDA